MQPGQELPGGEPDRGHAVVPEQRLRISVNVLLGRIKCVEHVLVRSNLLLMRRAKTVPKFAEPGRGRAVRGKKFFGEKIFFP